MTFPIRVSSVEREGLIHTSKPIKHAFLLSLEEMTALFQEIGPCFLIPASGLVSLLDWNISIEEFLSRYKLYVEWMESSATLPPIEVRRFFSLMLSSSLDSVYAVQVGQQKWTIKPCLPVIQIQMYHCFFSSFDHQIRSMVTNPDSFAWGIQISYPQIYEDPKTHYFSKVLLEERFSNSKIFKKIISWLRIHTGPVPLQEGEGRAYAPFRIGKQSLVKKDSHRGFQNLLISRKVHECKS